MISYVLPGFFVLLALVTLAMGAAALFMRRGAARDAREVYARRREESPGSLRGLDEAGFTRAFLRAHGPRGQIFITAALAAALVLTPLLMAGLDLAWRLFWAQAGRPAFYAPGVLMWQFYMFFGLVGVWAALAALAARLHHRRPRGSLDEEIIREAAGLKREGS